MEIEQRDDNQENIEVSYSTHLRERENVQKLLKGRNLYYVIRNTLFVTLDPVTVVLKKRFQITLKAESEQ